MDDRIKPVGHFDVPLARATSVVTLSEDEDGEAVEITAKTAPGSSGTLPEELLASTLQVSQARAAELLEAVGGSIERAVELHFSHAAATDVELPMATSSSPARDVPPEDERKARSRGKGGVLEQAKKRQKTAPKSPSAAPLSTFFKAGTGASSSQAKSAVAEQPLALQQDAATPASSSTLQLKHDEAAAKVGLEDVAAAAVPYGVLTTAFAKVAATTKRKEKDAILVEMFTEVLQRAPEDLVPAVYLSSNKLGPPWAGLDLGVGGSAITAAILSASGAASRDLAGLWKRHGDPGDVAAAIRSKQRLLAQPAPLTVRRVYDTLVSLCGMSGEGVANRKVSLMAGLIRATRDSEETRFLVRTFACHIRTQATLTTVKDAAVAAVMAHRKKMGFGEAGTVAEAQLAAREQFTACPDVKRLLGPLLAGGITAMQRGTVFSVGIPMRPMLAKAETAVERILSLYGGAAFACEHKYDGQRAQIHRDEHGLCKLFSRHLEDMTAKFPDIVEAMKCQCNTGDGRPKSFVLDAEVVAVAPPGNKGGDGASDQQVAGVTSDAFQRLSTRKRKDVTVGSIEVSVKVFAFDLLYIDTERIIDKPFKERRRLLHESFTADEQFGFAEYTDIPAESSAPPNTETVASDVEEPAAGEGERHAKVQEALDQSLVDKCEGLMCKALDAPYEPSDGSKRSVAWLKLKADYIEGMGDSLDLVPIGGWQGMGRKSKWISPFLLACWDPETESLQSVCRVLSGFTDAFYKEKTAHYLGVDERGGGLWNAEDVDEAVERPLGYRAGPDPRVQTDDPSQVWFEPCEVWEIKGASLSLSPKHKAGFGAVQLDRGLSLRFPRFIRLRPDKRVEDATTSAALVELFRKQQANPGSGPSRAAQGDDLASDCDDD